MPIRIKPVYDLGPCVLDLEGIKEICALVHQHFNQACFSAESGIWEVYNEPSHEFIEAISPHQTLDSFVVKAENRIQEGNTSGEQTNRIIEMVFDRTQATVKFSGPFEQENWFEHFLIDTRKHLRRPDLRQRLLRETASTKLEPFPIPAYSDAPSLWTEWLLRNAITSSRAKYCYIILRRNPPDPFIENIKANLVSNLIWLIIAFVGDIVCTFLAIWVYRDFGINVNDWLAPSIIPTLTPTP